MMNWSVEFGIWTDSMEFERTASEEEMIEKYSYVYIWLPYRIYCPDTLVVNYQFLQENEKAGNITESSVDLTNAPTNNEFMGVYNNYLQYHDPDVVTTGAIWGNYLSRVSATGGVATMYDLYTNCNKYWNEAFYITTPSMITRKAELNSFRNTTFLSIIMGETPIDHFDSFVAQWKALGGEDIGKEVNEWFLGQ